jgi:hypothetical protein
MKGPRSPKRRGRLYRWFEGLVLGMGMGVMVFFIERRLLKAIKAGGVKTRPEAGSPGSERQAQLVTAPHQIGNEPQR